MPRVRRVSGVYSRAERWSDAVVHAAGILLALMAAPVLVTLAAVWVHDRGLVFAAGVYGLTLIVMLCCSALYHHAPAPAWKDWLRRIDQSAIYLKIAGAYTPFAFMSGPQAMPFLAGLWAAAVAGVSIKLATRRQLFWLTIGLYLGMGWAAVVAGAPIIDRMTPEAFRLVLAGGVLYTVGVLFLIWDALPFHTTIWHVFVLAASFAVYVAVLIELAELAVLAAI